MLLKLNWPACRTDLELALKLIQDIIQYTIVESPAGFDESHFFVRFGMLNEHRNKARFLGSVIELWELSKRQRSMLLEAYQRDISFLSHTDAIDFCFSFSKLSKNTQDIGANLLVGFYDLLTAQGFSGLPGQRSRRINRTTFERHYRFANRDRLICPACLLIPLERPIEGRSLVHCEHFFPKSHYPTLSIHPANLVLLCYACNSVLHRDKPPIGPEPGAIRSTFLPYVRPGIEHIQLSFEFRFGHQRNGAEVKVKGADPRSASHVENFDRLYSISTRWGHRILEFGKALPGLVRRQLRGAETTKQAVRALLEAWCKQRSETAWKHEGGYLELQYLRWILTERFEPFVEQFLSPTVQ